MRCVIGWNKGAVIAQACHASVAVMAKFKEDPDVQEYTSPDNLEHMTKVVLKVPLFAIDCEDCNICTTG